MELGKRAKVACKSCHRRRVKCDVSEAQPCWQCRLRGSQCELTESRRGKYTRKRPVVTGLGDRAPENSSPVLPIAGVHGIPTPQKAQAGPITPSQPSSQLQHPGQPAILGSSDGFVPEHPAQDEGPEMLYTRLAECAPGQGAVQRPEDNMRTYYMGDSLSLAFIIRSLSGDTSHPPPKLHCPIPGTVAEHARDAAETLVDANPAAQTYLRMHNALELPSEDVRDQLIYTFFQCFHPAFPVLDRQEFCALYHQKRMSLLVLQTIFFLASTVCDENLLSKAGFVDRFSARRAFYLRAKALYDMDCEKSKQKLTAVLFLLGFWWEGPEDQKDTWHWLGAAISLAQTLGMHRSTASSGMSPRQRSMWKRIWWSIYVRDRHAAAALGRPCRINDDDCDVEMLVMEDFLVDDTSDNRLICVQQPCHQSYVIEMARLAMILGKLLKYQFAPRRTTVGDLSTVGLGEELEQWKTDLPSHLCQTSLSEKLDAPFWSVMLYACFYFCQILLYRPSESSQTSSQSALFARKARVAADSITRLVEDLLVAGAMSLAQLHLVPTIFAALSIHTLVIRGDDPLQKQLTENRARQCILGMSELAKGWPVAVWILRLFINLMKRFTEKGEAPVDGVDQQHKENFNFGHGIAQSSASRGGNMADLPRTDAAQSTTLHRPVGAQAENGHVPLQTDQIVADVLWSNPDELDFDMMLRCAQSNGLFPLNFE